MKYPLYFLLFVFSLLPLISYSQNVFYTESFENNDSLTLPIGWSRWNNATFPIDPLTNWTVRDSGVCMPRINCTRTSRAFDGRKSIMVTWGAGTDTANPNTGLIADAWLVTKQFRNLPNDAVLSFYACGGHPSSYLDSMEVWVSTGDSLPSSFTHYINTYIWQPGSVYGNFTNYIEDLSAFGGQNIRIAFRYYMDVSFHGYVVFLDKFQMLGTVGANQIGTNVPTAFFLHQNYPNPFNPNTNIKFDVPKFTNVKIEVFDNLGRLLKTIHNKELAPGYYEVSWYADNLPSGTYYYRLTAGTFVETKRMILVK